MSDNRTEVQPVGLHGLEIPIDNKVRASVARLRLFSPIRMAKIGKFLTERRRMAKELTIDNTDHGMGANRFFRETDYIATEGNIARQAIEGFTEDSLLTRKDWGNVVLAIGTAVNPQRRTQIFAELNHFAGETRDQEKKEAIADILVRFENIDPGIRVRAADESYFLGGVITTQQTLVMDTLSRLF